jgi:general secretion pathway protein M
MGFISSNALVVKLLNSYRQLEGRDQLALTLLTSFLLLLFLVFGMWQPLREFVDVQHSLRDSNRELVQLMRNTEKQARVVGRSSRSGPRTGQSLLALVSRSAKSANIEPNRLQPEGSDSVSVWFETVPFNDLVLWLENLESEQSVHVHQITVNRQEQSGRVNARVVLKS